MYIMKKKRKSYAQVSGFLPAKETYLFIPFFFMNFKSSPYMWRKCDSLERNVRSCIPNCVEFTHQAVGP